MADPPDSTDDAKPADLEPIELPEDPEPLPDNDSPWKELIGVAFPDFMAFFHPEAWADIDWARGHVSLDKELQKISVTGEVGRRYADLLIKVWLREGEELWVLVHIEVQGTRDTGFPRRMFDYRTRIHHRFGREVASIAILADDVPGWRPSSFHIGRWDSTTGCTFRSVKLLDYLAREEQLVASDNVFAIAVVAHLRARASRKQWPLRLRFKLELTVLLADKGWAPDKVRQVMRFIDWLMLLPKPWEDRYHVEVEALEEHTRMPYVTSFERRALKKGIDQGMELGLQQGRQEGRLEGRQEGEAALVLRLLTRSFGSVPEPARAQILRLDSAALEELADARATFASVGDLEAWLTSRARST